MLVKTRLVAIRNEGRPVYEQIFNHYVNRRGLSAQYTQKAIESISPEGAAFGADHTGFGTLLYRRPRGLQADTVSVANPAALYASNEQNGALTIQWVPPVNASLYAMKRTDDASGSTKFSRESLHKLCDLGLID